MEENEESSNFIDMELIENQKENIQPIKSGRSSKQLASLFKPKINNSILTSSNSTSIQCFDPIRLSQQRKQTHSEFQQKIKILEDALESKTIQNHQDKVLADQLIKDPLDIYLQYIRWTIESYPSGGTTAESNLIPLLEQVTRKFIKQERYQQDIRYLKCWIFYSDQVKTTKINPSQSNGMQTKITTITPNHSSKLILNFLIHNRIGTSFSLLYTEYFKLFLPIDRLKSSPDDRAKLEKILKFGISQTTQDLAHDQIIELLNQLENLKLEINQEEEGRKKEVTKPKTKLKTMMNSKKTKAKIKVFEDNGGEDDDDNEKNDKLNKPQTKEDKKAEEMQNEVLDKEDEKAMSPFSLISKWDNLGTVASNRKQNTLDPSAWKGQKLPMELTQPTRTVVTGSQLSSTSTHPIVSTTTTTRSSKIKVFEDCFEEEACSTAKNDQPKADETQIKAVDNQNSTSSSSSTTTRKLNENLTGFDLLDELLKSEIESQIHSIHHHRTHHDESYSQDHYEVLKFDPLKFHSL